MKNFAVLRVVCIAMTILASPVVLAIEMIDEAGINDFLASEKRLMEAKDADGLMSLFSEDYSQTSPREGTEGKDQVRLKFHNSFNTAKYVLFKPKIISADISPDGKSATVITDEITKYLVDRDGKQRVISYHTAVKSVLVLVGGEIRVRSTEKLRDLE